MKINAKLFEAIGILYDMYIEEKNNFRVAKEENEILLKKVSSITKDVIKNSMTNISAHLNEEKVLEKYNGNYEETNSSMVNNTSRVDSEVNVNNTNKKRNF